MPSSTPRTTAGIPWVLFCVSVVSVAVHLWSAFAGHHGLWMSAFMIMMAVACLPCTLSLLRSCSPRGLVVMISLAATSAVVHGAILLSALMTPGSHAGHAGHGTAGAAATGSAGHGVELIALVVLEAGVLILAFDLRARTPGPVRVASTVSLASSARVPAALTGASH
jgi:hypothetical protein